ncbi:hypothetical protein U2U97_002939 [Escherichia coli]|nr:hypothetical protein [Escherichia coli]EMA3831267.1 hypothetical protein [Escherichia coli]
MPTVPTVTGRQVESRGFQSPGLQTFNTPQMGDVLSGVADQYVDVFAQAKQRADVAQAQDASLQLSQVSSDLLTNPDTGLLNMQGKNALGKGQAYTQQFDAQAEQIAMTLPEGARAGFMQQAQQQRIQFTTQAGRHEISQLNAYEEGQFQATLANNGKLAAAAYGDNANYVLYNQQTFQQIEDYGIAHGWSHEQIQAKKIEFKEKVADASLSQWSANNSIEFIQSNGELSDTVTGSRRAVSEGGSGDSARGIRNNNPGNLEYSKTNPWVGQTGDDGRFAKFETPEHGIRALGRNLLSYQRQGIDTVNDIINRWAPPSDNNNTEAYIQAVCAQLGVTPDQPLDASNPDTLKALCASIIQHENGSQPYSDQQLANPDVSVSPESAAQTILSGAAARKGTDDVKGIPMPKDNDLRLEFSDMVKDAFAGDAQGASMAYEIAKDYYAGVMAKKGVVSGEIDSDTWKQAVNVATGGVHDYNGMGSVLLPWGMSAEQFDKQVDQAWKTQVTGAGIKAPPGQYGLQSYGDSQYLVKLGTGYLLKDDGTPVVIDLTQQRQRFSEGIPQ